LFKYLAVTVVMTARAARAQQRTTRTSAAAPAQDLKRLLPLVKRLPGDPHNIFLSAPAPVPSQP
jgi:hypothetical protein